MPTINKRFLLKLLLGVAAFTGVLVRESTPSRPTAFPRRSCGRPSGPPKPSKLDAAIHYYRQYLEFKPDDVEAQVKLVELMRKRNPTTRGPGRGDLPLRTHPARSTRIATPSAATHWPRA